ncbi:unnamed protein product [Mytilus coruscus]|uniref:Zinc finger PHD-type domain-containing protein n=1 Tax=Mytilus coruscus TaxID=42192 RepID=A0A6J8AC28_MYTCO|nr:unnamed protein product [Mytilus coruscus]
MIRNSCKQYLDLENVKAQKAVTKNKTSIVSSSIQTKESQLTPQQKEIGNKGKISSYMANNPSIINSTLPTCPICNKRCTNNCKAVGYDTCDQWFHYECEKLSTEEIKIIAENGDDNYICKTCKIQINALNDESDNESPTNARASIYSIPNPHYTPVQIISAPSTDNFIVNNNNVSSAMQHPRIMVPGMSKTQTIHKFGNNTNRVKSKRLQLQTSNKHGANLTNIDNTDISNGQHIGNSNISHQSNSSRPPTITHALYQTEINQLKGELEAKDKIIKSKENKICKLDSEITTLKKQIATNRSFTINLEQEKKDLEHSLVILRKRIEQLEGINGKSQESSNPNPTNITSESNYTMNEMKIGFLEQKVRQIELDMQKHDTKIMFMNEKLYCSNNNREEQKSHSKGSQKTSFSNKQWSKPHLP